MANEDKVGEGSKLYYQLTDFDITDTDVNVLADVGWTYLCVVDVSITRARTLQEVVDRCVGDDKEYVAGKRDTGITVNLNELRLTAAAIRAWHVISDTAGVISLLLLDELLDEADARGMVGNFLVEQDDQSQPAEGSNTQALSFKPAARSAFSPKVRRIYGSGIA